MPAFAPLNMIDFANKIEHHHVNMDMGAGSDIEYRHQDSNTVQTRAFVSFEEHRKNSTKDRKDEVYFLSVDLNSEPKYHDVIVFNSDKYIVKSWIEHGGIYDITTISRVSEKTRRNA